jgi:PAS domain S-box-containing protein
MEAVRTAEEHTRFALEAARVGIWDMDYTTGVLQWSKTLEAHYGLQPGTFGRTFEAFVELIHPDDRESVLETVARATKSGSDFWVQNRTIWPDGTVRWLNGVGRVLLGRNGEPVRAAGISLDVTERHSAVGRDTTFKLYSPRAEARERAVEAPPPVSRPRAGTQTVLVVDDAEEVRELACRLLQGQGYTVLVAANAEEALRLLEWNKSIDVLLTDVVMPGGSGPELAAWMVEQWPELKVVYMSGHTAEAIAHHGVLNPGIAFVRKPFTTEALGRTIREVLDR